MNATLRVDNHLLSNGVEGEWIGFNTLSNDITNPNAIINTLFHEASNKELHHKSNNDAYASNRGNSAESIFALKNYQGKNTNTISTLEWNQRENTRERLRGGGVLRRGNEYNRRAWVGELGGSGERDNARIKRRPLHKGIYLPMSDTKIFGKENLKLQHQHIFFEDEKGGNIGFFPDGVHADSDRHLHTYEDVDGKYYDDKMMREAIKRTIPQMQNYNLLQNNCQDFIKKVLQEYHFIEATK